MRPTRGSRRQVSSPEDGGALRLVLFADPRLASSMALLAGSLRAAAAREDVEVLAIVDCATEAPPHARLARAVVGTAVRDVFNLHTGAEPPTPPLLASCSLLSRRWRVPLLTPPRRDVNDAGFVEAIRALRPDATLALMVSQIFRAPLLAACNAPVNYHNGLLPRYRGVAATGWSIYEREQQSGFSFHRMVEQVDRGPVLLQGAVPVGPRASAAPVERAKTAAACRELGRLFDQLIAGGPAAPQRDGSGSGFSRADVQAIQTVEDPRQLTYDELERRLRSFEKVNLTIAGRSWSATALRRSEGRARNGHFTFTTADGISAEVIRVVHLPPALYRVLRGVLSVS